MIVKIYLDESGDLGWEFSKPFRNGGSSRYLTIAYLIIPEVKQQLPKRIVRNFYKHFNLNTGKEKKGSDLNEVQREYIVNETIQFLSANNDCIIGTITVKKENVMDHIRADGNKIYNYMMNLAISPKVTNATIIRLVRDRRNIKVKSGNSCGDYLQTQLWFEYKSKAKLIDLPEDSHKNLSLLFIDWICNTIWKFYEDRDKTHFDNLRKKVDVRELYF